MISLETIEREISELEARETSYRLCERLSWLYTVRDHLLAERCPQNASVTPGMEGSEFLEAASGVPYRELMRVMDEHLETIRLIYPKTYDSLVQRIRDLR